METNDDHATMRESFSLFHTINWIHWYISCSFVSKYGWKLWKAIMQFGFFDSVLWRELPVSLQGVSVSFAQRPTSLTVRISWDMKMERGWELSDLVGRRRIPMQGFQFCSILICSIHWTLFQIDCWGAWESLPNGALKDFVTNCLPLSSWSKNMKAVQMNNWKVEDFLFYKNTFILKSALKRCHCLGYS